MAGAQDITSSLTGGSLAGLIQIRDQEISSIGTSLDQLASGLATALNTANAQGYDLNGNQGGNIFAPPPAGGVGAAAAMTVTMTDPALVAASSDGTSGSNGNLANLSAVANQAVANGQTPIDAYPRWWAKSETPRRTLPPTPMLERHPATAARSEWKRLRRIDRRRSVESHSISDGVSGGGARRHDGEPPHAGCRQSGRGSGRTVAADEYLLLRETPCASIRIPCPT